MSMNRTKAWLWRLASIGANSRLLIVFALDPTTGQKQSTNSKEAEHLLGIRRNLPWKLNQIHSHASRFQTVYSFNRHELDVFGLSFGKWLSKTEIDRCWPSDAYRSSAELWTFLDCWSSLISASLLFEDCNGNFAFALHFWLQIKGWA